MININEKFVKDTFKFHKDKFSNHLKLINEVKDYTKTYSNCSLGFQKYNLEMNQMNKPKIYKRTPKNLEGKFENRLLNDTIYFSKQLGKSWINTCFYQIKDENQNNIGLHYDGTPKEPELNQIYISIFEKNKLNKVLFYHSNNNFMEDSYSYDNQGRVEKIIRDGYWGNSNSILPTRTFRFDYDNNNELTLFSKQLKQNGENNFEQIFPKVKQ
ncbi:hypothetical protein [uncultured Maribacter sp.]|uniref:hypothetical protein n=1 Tax=uncultured Maribacter sp. TaxID=431308 RepID=UPI002622189A|nr:hypothetical protein [uncultured Maribacter sp.]